MSVFGNEVLLEASAPSEDESSDDSILRQYKEENEMLKKQNEQLRRTVNIFTQPASIKVKDPSKDGPIAHVLLFNNIVARRHCEEIKHFFHSLASRPNGNDDFTLNPPQSSALHYLQPDPTPHRTKRTTREVRKASKAYVVTDSFQIFSEMFYLDQIGEAMTRDEGLESLPPYYERARPDPLDGEVDEIDPTKMNRSSRLCFNCGMKDHQVKDCPSPRNFKNISQRRMQFQGMKGNSPRNEGKSGNSRYHADQDSESNRFSEFKPGIVSPQLREALGIQHHELPTYIYQMRWHGYPPGHMADARINASGLNIFDGNQSDAQDSEGLIDVDKLITYPGFNVAPAKHIVEDPKYPPMDERHSKDVLVSYHSHKNQLLKKKREGNTPKPRKRQKIAHRVDDITDDIMEVDMEIGGNSDTEVATEDQRIVIESSVEEEMEEGECGEEEEQDEEEEEDVQGLDERELEVRRAAILHKLQHPDDVVVISSDDDVKFVNDVENDVTHVDNGESDVTHVDNGESDVTHVDNGESDVTHVDNRENDVTHVDNRENDVTHVDNKENDVTHVDNGENDVTHVDNKENDVTHVDNGQNDVTHVDNGENDVTHVDNGQNDVTHFNNGQNDVTHVDNGENDVTKVDNGENDVTNIEGKGNDVAHVDSMLFDNTKIDKNDVCHVDDVENDVSPVNDVPKDVSLVDDQSNDVNPVNDVPNDFSNDVDNRTPSTATAVSLKDDDATIIRDDTQADNDHVIDGETTNNDVINVTSSIDDSDINDVNNDVSKSPNVVVGGITDDAGQNVTNTSPKSVEQSDCDLTTSSCDTSTPKNNDVIIKDDVSPGVPHRSKFAAGVTQFDAYYRETKSLGKFNKLKHLLRNSPRRQTKDQ